MNEYGISMESYGQEKIEVLGEKPKPTWAGLGLNPGLFSERPVANNLNHVMIEYQSYL
jgi:hypothetical protein